MFATKQIEIVKLHTLAKTEISKIHNKINEIEVSLKNSIERYLIGETTIEHAKEDIFR